MTEDDRSCLKKEDEFSNGTFWELYSDLERQFIHFLEYVPYLSGNEQVYSFKLLNLILSIGGHVASCFIEMAFYQKFSNNEYCSKILDILQESEIRVSKGKAPISVPVWLSLKAFEEEYKLSKAKVIFKHLPERTPLLPFEPDNPQTQAPEWWDFYNGLKHDVGINLKKANLKNSALALAGAFVLNVRHEPAILRFYDYGLLKLAWTEKFKGKIAREEILRDQVLEMLGKHCPFYVETPVFLFNFAEET